MLDTHAKQPARQEYSTIIRRQAYSHTKLYRHPKTHHLMQFSTHQREKTQLHPTRMQAPVPLTRKSTQAPDQPHPSEDRQQKREDYGFSRVHHILGNKTSLSIFNKIKIISSIFYDHSSMRLEKSYRENCKNTNTWKLKNIHTMNKRSLKKSKRKKLENYHENTQTQHHGMQQNTSKKKL